MLYNYLMRKIPLIWLILSLVFPPAGNAFPAMQPDQTDQQPPCHEQATGMSQQHDRQAEAGDADDCCEQGSAGMASECCEHCPAPLVGLLIGVALALPDATKSLISNPVLSYPPQLTNLPYKPPRA